MSHYLAHTQDDFTVHETFDDAFEWLLYIIEIDRNMMIAVDNEDKLDTLYLDRSVTSIDGYTMYDGKDLVEELYNNGYLKSPVEGIDHPIFLTGYVSIVECDCTERDHLSELED